MSESPTAGGGDPYDELPYLGKPVDWMAPERLALVSCLHGGPRPPLDRYRMLEVGCGDGANLIALAYYRTQAEFVGIDTSRQHIEIAQERAAALDLDNLRFVQADILQPDAHLSAPFDYIAAHGVFSWVPEPVRDALLDLHRRWLAPQGLFFVDYNALPGWNMRGMVRRFLRSHVARVAGLRAQVDAARTISAHMEGILEASEHAYSQLLCTEFGLVARAEPTYVAHEYLNPYNRPYWSSEFEALARAHDLRVVAEADFDRSSGRRETKLDQWLRDEGVAETELEDASDLVVYRQMRSPILTAHDWVPRMPTRSEFGELRAACSFVDEDPEAPLPTTFTRADGQRVRVETESMRQGLRVLSAAWPASLRLADAFADLADDEEDIRLLHRFGLLELHCVDPREFPRRETVNRLHELETAARGEITTADHRRIAVPGSAADED
jgi:SAM-dependent methyltransferase